MGYRGAPHAFVGPQYQDRLLAKIKAKVEANGALAGGPGTGVFSRTLSRCEEAKRVLELALEAGHLDHISAIGRSNVTEANAKFKESLREACLELLAGQYPELDVEVKWGDRVTIATGNVLTRGGVAFRVYNRGTVR